MPNQNHGAPTVAPVVTSDSLVGFSADGITLESLLVEGVSSRTYRGRRSDGQALQVWIAAEHLAGDAAFVARFRQEAAQLAALHHVHVETCQGHRLWPAPNGRSLVALVEEASTGIPLGDLVRREALPVRDVLRLLHQACAGLAAAHRVGIVHGDITLDSVLVTAGGAAKLRSFALGVSGYSVERTGRSLIGSPDFMAPEVGRGQQPSSLSDLYGMGAVLSTVLAGDVPFPAATALETIHLHGSAVVSDFTVSYPEFALVTPLITRLMAKDPAQRWMGTEDLALNLLVLSNQIAGEVRCRPWLGRRPVPLSALVQTALAQRREELPLPSPPQERSGGTTTISRNSVEVFRNPDMFKPTGLTPAAGLPILTTTTADKPPTSRVVRQMVSSGTTVPESPATPSRIAPAKTASYLSGLAAAQSAEGSVPAAVPANVPTGSTKRSLGWLVPIMVLLVAGVVLLISFIRDERPALLPLASVPMVAVEPPAMNDMGKRITAIVALGTHDPTAALIQAAQLRRDHPTAELSRLPVSLHLSVAGPEVSAVRVTSSGEPVAVSAGQLCRMRGEPLSLRIEAAGFRAQEIHIPASSADELRHQVALLNEPHWTLPAFAPTWVRLSPSPDGVLLVSDRKVVLIAAGDGREVRRLDRAVLAALPENLTWSSVLSVASGKIRLGVTGGLCVDASATDLMSVSEVHRGQSSVLALQVLPLTLRLGEEGIFLIERETSGFTLAADNRERRLWSRPLNGALIPWLSSMGDRLLVIDDHQIRRFSQEGEEPAPVLLPAPRTGVPIGGGAAGVVIPTTNGVIRLTSTLQALPGPSGVVDACVGDATMIVAACGRGLFTWGITGEQVTTRWSHPDLVAADRRVRHLTLTTDQVIAVDDQGTVRIFSRSQGTVVRTLRTGGSLLAPPILSGGRLIAVLAPGVVAAY